MTAFTFAPLSLCLDLETAFDDASKILKFAAWRSDTNASLTLAGQEIAGAIAEINALTAGAVFVLGHNIRRHDLPSLAQNYPDLDLLKLPLVDTLELAPIAFPANPYHPLLKDYTPCSGNLTPHPGKNGSSVQHIASSDLLSSRLSFMPFSSILWMVRVIVS